MDKREAILSHLLESLSQVPTLLGYDEHTTFRNRGELKQDKRPSIVLLDGTEYAWQYNVQEHLGRGHLSPALMIMSPQIFVLLKPSPLPSNLGIGEELDAFRVAIISQLARDKVLVGLCGPNGGVALRKVDTDMQTGSTLQGQMRMDFAISYVLDPYALEPIT